MEKNIILRQTTGIDLDTIYQLIQTAFETAEHRDGTEQDYAVGLRNGNDYIPQLDLVAELNGKLVGHIMLTKTHIALPDGSQHPTLLVAPLSVLIEQRGTGIGSALMNEGLGIARSLGYTSAFLIGDPDYYRRFGYKQSHHYGIVHETFPPEYVMAKEIIPGALDQVTGVVRM